MNKKENGFLTAIENSLPGYQVPLTELNRRMNRFIQLMDEENPGWQTALIFSKVNLLYFSGTMPEGLLLIRRGEAPTLWVRRGIERASVESLLPDIRPMDGFRDIAAAYPHIGGAVHVEAEILPLAVYQRLAKYINFSEVKPLDMQVNRARSVKSAWELKFMEMAGEIHRRVMEDFIPGLLREGMTESEFATLLYKVMVDEGHMGTARFGMFDTEMAVGQIGFGESSLCPTSFNGPGGNAGMYPAMPALGSRVVRLREGNLVFVDVALAVNGYHTDKTMTYMFGKSLPSEALEAHQQCLQIQNMIAGMLKPGNVPSEIYETIMSGLSPAFKINFMGFGNRQVKFLGHGTGLTVDEVPVLAKGFDLSLEENMVIAVEPKKGIEGVGMVGIENTFVVTPTGGRCITGNSPGLLLVT